MSATPSPGAEYLAPVRDLPGLSHACLVDESDGRVLAAIGADDEGTVAAVLAWGRRAGAVAADRGRTLDDLIVTTDAAHHLLRAVGGSPEGPWAYLRVRREDGNLALARRQLAAVTTVPAQPALPPPSRSGDRPGTVPFPRRTPTGAGPSARPWASPPAASPAALVPTPAPIPTPTPTPTPTAAPPAAVPVLPAPRTAQPAGPPAAAGPGWRTTVRDSAGVLGQRWRTDPETLRRVLAGLLGLGPGPQKAIAGRPDPTTTRSPGATPTRRNP
ncbi:hypothetical protein ACQPX6_14810 [Actinomycetospora sp. CA-101289]|uniref:hypothetical protein n=1 Tax=Actinomycetospora sp. CA-101289 TaxID=3239893 RepID=UPI003D960877